MELRRFVVDAACGGCVALVVSGTGSIVTGAGCIRLVLNQRGASGKLLLGYARRVEALSVESALCNAVKYMRAKRGVSEKLGDSTLARQCALSAPAWDFQSLS